MDIEAGQHAERRLDIGVPSGPRLGDIVVRARNLRKGYGDKILVEDLDLICLVVESSGLLAQMVPERRPCFV